MLNRDDELVEAAKTLLNGYEPNQQILKGFVTSVNTEVIALQECFDMNITIQLRIEPERAQEVLTRLQDLCSPLNNKTKSIILIEDKNG